MIETMREHLNVLYGPRRGGRTLDRLARLLAEFAGRIRRPIGVPAGRLPLDERDAVLITYGDQFRRAGEPPLRTLADFLTRHLNGVVSGVHLLPFFPYTSDDGFSVVDFLKVQPGWGDWEDVERIGRDFRLMMDLVLNHASASSAWFRGFLEGDRRYRDWFITEPPGTDLSAVFRPRSLPLLTPFETGRGRELLWTTFSADQIDLNYRNPEVLLEMLRVLLTYVARGAQWLRLDAVAYLWKEEGTRCLHLEQTHAVVRLFRAVLDHLCPWVMLITETNVPHPENISYFGNGHDEAQLVYQFSLPPLVLDAFRRGDASRLSGWAAGLGEARGETTFFNFLASHDGIGVVPAHGLLSPDELRGLQDMVEGHGGFVSTRSTPEGDLPYELNVTWLDAVSHPQEEERRRVRKFLASQAIMLALAGLPGIYIHSLLGSPNDRPAAERTGQRRAINRARFDLEGVEGLLSAADSPRARVFSDYRALLLARGAHPAFHPRGAQEVLSSGGPLFALARTSPDGRERLLCLHNTAPDRVVWPLDSAAAGSAAAVDVLSGRTVALERGPGGPGVPVDGYGVLWLSGPDLPAGQATSGRSSASATGAARAGGSGTTSCG